MFIFQQNIIVIPSRSAAPIISMQSVVETNREMSCRCCSFSLHIPTSRTVSVAFVSYSLLEIDMPRGRDSIHCWTSDSIQPVAFGPRRSRFGKSPRRSRRQSVVRDSPVASITAFARMIFIMLLPSSGRIAPFLEARWGPETKIGTLRFRIF